MEIKVTYKIENSNHEWTDTITPSMDPSIYDGDSRLRDIFEKLDCFINFYYTVKGLTEYGLKIIKVEKID